MIQTNDDLSQTLFEFLNKYFDRGELQTLCFKMGVDHEDLAGETRRDIARELIRYCQRHGWIPNLLLELKKERPQQFQDFGLTAPTDKPILNPFPANLTSEVAYPIAVACHDFNRATDDTAVSQFISLDRLLENLIKYLLAVALTQYWRSQPDSAQLHLWLGKLSQPSLSAWLEVWEEIGECYAADPAPPRLIPILYDTYQAPVGENSAITAAYKFIITQLTAQQLAVPQDLLTIGLFLKQLLRYCHLSWEGKPGELAEEMRDALLPLLQPALQELLLALPIMSSYSLFYLGRADLVGEEWVYTRFSFQGHEGSPIEEKPLLKTAVAQEPEFKLRRLYLCDASGNPLLNLHPLLIAYRQPLQLYFFEYNVDDQEIWFRHCGSSERFLPPLRFKSLRESLFNLAQEDDADQNPVKFLSDTENIIEETAVDDEQHDELPLTVLLTKLSDEGREALEIGLGEALRIGRFWLGVEFLLMGLSKQRGRPLPRLLREMGLHPGEYRGFYRGFIKVLDQTWREKDPQRLGQAQLPHIEVATSEYLAQQHAETKVYPPVLTPRMKTILNEAYKLAGEEQIGHRHLLVAALGHHRAVAIQMLFSLAYEAEWSPRQVVDRVAALVNMKPEELPPASEQGDVFRKRPSPPPMGGSVLEKIGHNLTQAAADGKLGEAYGENARHALSEIGRVLLKKEGNNPIILGESGVGKTAVVEGFAWRLAGQGKSVIPQLQDKQIVQISAADLMAGTKYRGDLEKRLEQLVTEVKEADGQMIIFIDEIHTILSSDSSSGLSTIAEKLKPVLARGEFPCIGATTVAEYRRYIEKDPTLVRRFSPVWLEEPTVDDAIKIVTHVASTRLSKHHSGITFTLKGIETAVTLSARYIHDQRLPGKAIKVLDEAASSLIMGGSLSGEAADMTMVYGNQVTAAVVTSIIAAHTNIPAEQLTKSNKQRLRELEGKLKTRIIGQDEAINRVVRVLKRSGTGFANEKRPLGVFLFTGPTGVGKTELALALAEALFDDEEAIFRLDMSEFMEKHQVSRLIGAPPGYVRSEEEGQLTGRLRRRPYSVVLLDEMEKAHEDVQHLFLQLFDNGRLTDTHGNIADGRQAIFIMTTNLGAKEVLGFGRTPTYRQKLKTAVYEHFSPEFMNRLDRIVYFAPLDETALMAIFDKEFQPFQERFQQQGIQVEIPQAIKRQIVQQVVKQKMGARPLQRFIEDQIVAPLIDKLLEEEEPLAGSIKVGQDIEVRAMSLAPWAEQLPASENPIDKPPQNPKLFNLDLDFKLTPEEKPGQAPFTSPLPPTPQKENDNPEAKEEE